MEASVLQPAGTPRAPDLEADLRRARTLAHLMDAQFEILGVRFGWDPIIGLVPILGDVVAIAAGAYPIWIARKHGLGKWLHLRMGWNLLVDCLIGLIPVIDVISDVAFKANIKNLKLLEKAAAARR